MIQYLLNTTAIWLLSLLLYELLLKKETFHSYNRFYLVSTLLLGILLPLWQWPDNTVISGHGIISKPISSTLHVKEQISTGITSQSSSIDWSLYVTYLYVVGVIVSLLLLTVAVVKLGMLYRGGKKTKDGAWTVIETGKRHTPFSIFNFVFIESKTQYTTEQWKIILTHEQLHSMAFHFADMLLVQLTRIAFWFHPLVYIYQKKLSLVHEYQADNASAGKVKQYGPFLLEQS
ncbi:MAG: M56 family metallopeptidase, partial [Flavipsychrobacter sp.]